MASRPAACCPMMKHMPGHGRAMVDSHHKLPVVDVSFDELAKSDFLPFVAHEGRTDGACLPILSSPQSMPDNPATTSAKVVQR